MRLSQNQLRLRREVVEFLDHELPLTSDRSIIGPEWSSQEEFEEGLAFCRRLAHKGWFVPHWPIEYGGSGLGAVETLIIQEELAYRRAPLVNHNGTAMLGPILMRFGSDVQKVRFLPAIARCETLWCQGYSEPDAGSDLASLRFRAKRQPDGSFVLSGTKTWTGHAHHADWMFLLARTDPTAPKRDGLTFFLVDMRSPGITRTPIRSLAGISTFCEEFFDDVRVPAENVVGGEGRGWAIAKALLDLERSNLARAAEMHRQLDELRTLLDASGSHVGDLTAVELGRLIERVEVSRALSYRTAVEYADGRPTTSRSSIAKLFNSELQVEIPRVAGRLLPEESVSLPPADDSADRSRGRIAQQLLMSMLRTIAGGSSEIQRDIIATAVLQLPRS